MEGCTAGGGRHAAPTQKRDIYLPGGGDFQPGFMAEQGDCAGSQLLGSPSARPPVSCIRRDAGWGLQATWPHRLGPRASGWREAATEGRILTPPGGSRSRRVPRLLRGFLMPGHCQRDSSPRRCPPCPEESAPVNPPLLPKD